MRRLANPCNCRECAAEDTWPRTGFHRTSPVTPLRLRPGTVNLFDTEFKDYFNDYFNKKYLYPRDTRRYDRTYEFGLRASF